MSLVLGLDVGTQGTKGVVVDVDRRCVVARASAPYGLIEGLPDGCAEQDPRTWLDAVRDVARELLANESVDRARVAAVGVAGQQHGLVLCDARGEVLRPAKLWCDTSTSAEARELSEAFGRKVPTGYTAPKLLWVKRHEPAVWNAVKSVLLPHDWVNFRLTGETTMEAGDASGTGLFDPVRREFARDELGHIDARLADWIPRLLRPGELAGTLSEGGAALLGLPAGLPVASGGGDNMMSAVGSGATRPGVVVVSLGTSGTVFTHSDTPVVDPSGAIAPFCSSTGGWLPLVCVMNVTGVTEEVALGFRTDHARLSAAATKVPIGCDGLIWIPYLAGERVPDLPDARGVLTGMRAGHLRPGVLYRAALEGTSLNLAWGVERLRALGIAIDTVHLVGGAARNPLWRQILADCLACPVLPLAEPESAAFGAALHALWSLRLSAGESVSADDVAAPFVRFGGEATAPSAVGGAAYAELLERFRETVARYFGVDGEPSSTRAGRTPRL